MTPTKSPSLRTSLYSWHIQNGAAMVDYAGYQLPLHYADGAIFEHHHTRNHAGLFDVSHMGQIILTGDMAIKRLEKNVPSDVRNIRPGQMRYSTLLNDWGGVIDDLIIVRPDTGNDLWLIVNAALKNKDFSILGEGLSSNMIDLAARDLISIQGSHAVHVIRHETEDVEKLGFMRVAWTKIRNIRVLLMRSGYTGEDGFEISVEKKNSQILMDIFLEDKDVRPVGLAARETLRLEAGLCLYGNELNEKTTPVEAGLKWIISKQRLSECEFSGATILESELLNFPERCRVGLILDDAIVAEKNAVIQDHKGNIIGMVTSACHSPTLDQSIAMGYVEKYYSGIGSKVHIMMNGQDLMARIVSMPFVTHRTVKENRLF
jgi:aminomethyltransferase